MPEHRLIIMRHAKSDWNSRARMDFDRPLNARGEKDASRMGKWLKNQQYIPERIISSAARRAQQTSEAVALEIGKSTKDIIQVANIYEASLDDLRIVIEQYSSDIRCLLLVGHNPGLEELSYHLTKDNLPLNKNNNLLTAGAAIVFNFDKHTISSEASTAKFEKIMRPKELR